MQPIMKPCIKLGWTCWVGRATCICPKQICMHIRICRHVCIILPMASTSRCCHHGLQCIFIATAHLLCTVCLSYGTSQRAVIGLPAAPGRGLLGDWKAWDGSHGPPLQYLQHILGCDRMRLEHASARFQRPVILVPGMMPRE